MAQVYGSLIVKGNMIPLCGDSAALVASLNIPKNMEYVLGLDQSTTSTGLYFRSLDKRVKIVMEVKNSCADKYEYFRELKYLVMNLVKDLNLRFFIIEKPVKSEWCRGNNALQGLIDRVREWVKEVPELNKAVFGQLFPQEWKALMVDRSKGGVRERMKSKRSMAIDILEKYPELEQMFGLSSSSYDSFDAVGIVEGYLLKYVTENFTPNVCGEKKDRKSYVLFEYIRLDEIQANSSVIYKNLQPIMNHFEKPVMKNYNKRESLYNNIKMGADTGMVTSVVTDPMEVLGLLWESNQEYSQYKVMLMHIIPYTKYRTLMQRTYLQDVYRKVIY